MLRSFVFLILSPSPPSTPPLPPVYTRSGRPCARGRRRDAPGLSSRLSFLPFLRSIHARFSSREHRVLPRYLRPSPSSFILSGRVGGSGENLGAISICRLLCLLLSFSPSPPRSLFLLLVDVPLSRSRKSATRPRFARLALSLDGIVASSLSPIRYRKLASGTLSRGSVSKR